MTPIPRAARKDSFSLFFVTPKTTTPAVSTIIAIPNGLGIGVQPSGYICVNARAASLGTRDAPAEALTSRLTGA